MRRFNAFVLSSVVIFLIIIGCSPKIISAPAPVPQPAPVPVAQPAASAATASPEDAAWAKVVEAAKKEGKLTVYSVHLVGDAAIATTQAFTKRTGLGLEIIAGQSTVLLERLKVERRMGAQIGDMNTGNVTLLLLAKQDGLTQKIGYLPELKDEGIRRYDPWVDTGGHVLSFSQQVYSPWVNTRLVSPGTEPKSWRDFLKPEWRGKIGIADPALDPGPNIIFYPLTSRGKLEPAYFSELGKQSLVFYPTSRMAAQALAQGEVPLFAAGSVSTAGPMVREGAPLKAIDMAEGVPVYRAGVVALFQGAPHPNASRVFINWFFSKEGQTVFQKIYGSTSFRKDVPSFEPPQALTTPANPVLITAEDEPELAKTLKDKVVSKLLRGN